MPIILITLLLSAIIPLNTSAEQNSTSAPAETDSIFYITDQLKITLRSGTSNEHRIIKSLTAGTKVKLLALDKPNYAQIQTKTGLKGWVLKRFLVQSPTANFRLVDAQNEIQTLQQTIRHLKNQLLMSNPMDNVVNVEAKIQAKEMQAIAAKKINLYEENKTLKNQLLSLRHELQSQQQEKSQSQDRANREWFLVGVAVWITGMVLGLMLPSMQSRKKQSWHSL